MAFLTRFIEQTTMRPRTDPLFRGALKAGDLLHLHAPTLAESARVWVWVLSEDDYRRFTALRASMAPPPDGFCLSADMSDCLCRIPRDGVWYVLIDSPDGVDVQIVVD
jgi:hypothetical protein